LEQVSKVIRQVIKQGIDKPYKREYLKLKVLKINGKIIEVVYRLVGVAVERYGIIFGSLLENVRVIISALYGRIYQSKPTSEAT
jgi:hypothetical protein